LQVYPAPSEGHSLLLVKTFFIFYFLANGKGEVNSQYLMAALISPYEKSLGSFDFKMPDEGTIFSSFKIAIMVSNFEGDIISCTSTSPVPINSER
jgi:hypothetical protein